MAKTYSIAVLEGDGIGPEIMGVALQVLRLVAKGLTNSQIADELALSEKTIAHHLTHIFNKTASDNRAAAVTLPVETG